MNSLFKTILIFNILICFCFPSHSQTNPRISQITNYCDSINNVTAIQIVRKVGAGITLDYIISNGEVIKIIEQPAGYKFISAAETYYFQNNKPVYVSADIEISNGDGDRLTIELHKIYIADNRIFRYLTSEQTFNADSLYHNSSDPVKTAENIRKNASFKPKSVDPEFERKLLQTIDNYRNAKSKKDGDPVFNELTSPFI